MKKQRYRWLIATIAALVGMSLAFAYYANLSKDKVLEQQAKTLGVDAKEWKEDRKLINSLADRALDRPEDLETIKLHLKSKSMIIRVDACRMLARIDDERYRSECIELLESVLDDSEDPVRMLALKGIARHDPDKAIAIAQSEGFNGGGEMTSAFVSSLLAESATGEQQ